MLGSDKYLVECCTSTLGRQPVSSNVEKMIVQPQAQLFYLQLLNLEPKVLPRYLDRC